MKAIALVLLIAGILLACFLGLLYFFGFIMSFDAPGSADDPRAWGFRILMILPILALLIALAVSIRAYAKGRYGRSVVIGLVYCGAAAGLVIAAYTKSARSVRTFQESVAKDEDDARRYPKETFLRYGDGVTDTILVFPSRIVAFRLNSHPGYPLSGPLGELNSTRDTIIYDRSPHTKVSIGELREFVNDDGQRVIDVYAVR